MKKGNITEPDEATLTLWMDGELEGSELKSIELWAQGHPELLAERDAIQAVNKQIRQNIPSSVEPPYPEFFNQQVLRQIHNEQDTPATTPKKSKRNIWQWLAMPAMAAAMAICFGLGIQYGDKNTAAAPVIVQNTWVYTPDGSVSADVLQSGEDASTVILLDGLDDIPDDVDIVSNDSADWSGSLMVNTGTSTGVTF